MQVAQAEQRQRREMRARRFATDREPARVILEQPEGGVFTVDRRRGEAVLGGEPVAFDAHRGEAGVGLGELPQEQVLRRSAEP